MQITAINRAVSPAAHAAERPAVLSALGGVQLDGPRASALEAAAARADGALPWRRRKLDEARVLLALSQLAPAGRMEVADLDLAGDFRAIVLLDVPVPHRPDPADERVVVGRRAILGILYPEAALRRALPGSAFVHVLAPHGVWHPNVAQAPGQPLCLGARLPAGIPARELVLMAFAALSMQVVTVDERDAAGVMNSEAARWWQLRQNRIPLSRTPFLGDDDLRAAPAVFEIGGAS